MNILTFDIEDWWVYDYYSIGNSRDYLPRLNRYLAQTLDLLDERKFQATFFCLGEVANKNPEIIKEIAKRGHQIGSHSFSHKFWGEATPKEVATDTYKAIDSIENITGQKVTSYRAPAFSIMEKNKWIFEILAENGIKQDCSIFPANRSFGGFPSFNQKIPSIVNYQGFQIKEFPISTTSLFGNQIAYSGGGYFRLLPYSKIKSIIKNTKYVMTYFHIKDFDSKQERKFGSLQGESSLVRYVKDYYGLKNNFSKFIKLLSDFDFISLHQADEKIDWNNAPLVDLN